jgi:hypothetical protein
MWLFMPAGSVRVPCRRCRTPIDLDWNRCPACEAADPIRWWARLDRGAVLSLLGALLLFGLTLL